MYVDNNTCVDEAELLAILKTVLNASDYGVVNSENVTSSQWITDWDLPQSIYFISTTITTIGSSLYLSPCFVTVYGQKCQAVMNIGHES